MAHPGYAASRYLHNRERLINQMRNQRHGLPEGWYASKMKEVDGKCMICGMPQTDKRFTGLCVDHNHSNGDIRGLLCSECNHGLGKFRDRPDILRRAAEYLERDPLIKK